MILRYDQGMNTHPTKPPAQCPDRRSTTDTFPANPYRKEEGK